MNAHAEMTAAAAETARVVSNIRPDQLDDPTRCPGWDVRTLLNHIILWTAYSAEQRAYGNSVAEELMSKDFAAEPDFVADYAKQVDRAVAAWSDPAAWERDLDVMGNSMAAADIAAMLIMEMALHGWDLAAATGQDYRLDDTTAGFVLATVREQADMWRQYQGFAAEVAVDAGAPAFDRALALSGRDPGRG